MNKTLFFLYGALLLIFAIFSYVFVDPNLIYLKDIYIGFAFEQRLLTTGLYVVFVFLFFIFYFLFLQRIKNNRLKFPSIKKMLVTTVVILFFAYPAMLSYDIFNYIFTAKVLYFYHENPYLIMPIEFIRDPFLVFTHAANKIALYGPFWIILTGIPYLLGLGNFLITLFSFKIFVSIFYLAMIFLIWKISKNITSVVLFSFNPLVVIETLVSVHNDIVMMFLVLFSFFLLTKKKILLATLFFTLSVLIKYSTIVLIPLFLYALWKIVRRREVNWEKVFYFSSLLMYIAFLLSPIREEIYPWYAIWFLTFAFLVPQRKILLYVSLAFSFSLLLRYTPYMLTGTYASQTPILKEVISFSFPLLYGIYYGLKKKI